MSTTFLSPLSAPGPGPAPAHEASRTAKSSDSLTRQGQGKEFGQALARSVSNAQHSARRDQAALDAKGAEARRASLLEESGKKARAQDEDSQGNEGSEELQGKDPSNAALGALGVLDWLGAQVKAQAPGPSGDGPPVKAADLLDASKDHANLTQAEPIDAAEGHTHAAAVDEQRGETAGEMLGEQTLASAGSEARAVGDAQAASSNALAKPGDTLVNGMGSGALARPDAQALPRPEGQALGLDARRKSVVRSGAQALPGPIAQSDLAPRSQFAMSKAAASFAASTSASASSSALSKAEGYGSAGPDSSAHAADGRSAMASKAVVAGDSLRTEGGLASLALDTSTSALAASENLATPSPAQALGRWGQLEPEVGTPAWQQALSQQIMQMRRGNANEAELQLNPLGLGPLRIKLSLREQELHAEFSAAHAQVREALEDALPQLREALQQGGFQLGQAVVDTGAQSDQSSASLASSGFAGSGTSGRDSQGGAGNRVQTEPASPQSQRTVADQLAAQRPGQSQGHGPGQRLNTFA